MAALRDQLDILLAESSLEASRRERTTFDELTVPFERRLILFGAGKFGRRTLNGLCRIGIEPIAFIDNRSSLWGESVCGLRVLSPEDAAHKYARDAAVVISIWNGRATDRMTARRHQLASLGFKKVALAGELFWKYPHEFPPWYQLDLPHKLLERADEVRAGFDLWRDEISRREYIQQVKFRLYLDFDALAEPHSPPYTSGGSAQGCPVVYVDCGAFDGDTILEFLRSRGFDFDAIFAYEPDPLNWDKLQKTVSSLPEDIRNRVRCFRQAVGSSRQEVSFSATGTDLSCVGAGTMKIACITLDESLSEVFPTLIKLDIEGYELEALKGAAEIISRCLPEMEVSSYHLQSHLWEVPLMLRQLAPERYSYFLRPHGTEGWDLVCHAIDKSRLE